MPVPVFVEDVVRLRKVHPCGGYEWRVVRIGADIGLKCLTCGRHIMIPRTVFERRLKAFVSRSPLFEAPSSSAATDPSSQ